MLTFKVNDPEYVVFFLSSVQASLQGGKGVTCRELSRKSVRTSPTGCRLRATVLTREI